MNANFVNMLWKWNGYAWQPINEHAEFVNMDAYICAPGPEFSKYDLSAFDRRGTFTLGLNSVYPYFKPDMWIGMDKAKSHPKELWGESFPKIVRGTFGNELINDRPWKEYPRVYFIRAKDGNPEDLMNNVGPNAECVWMRSTMISGIHLLFWMGYKRIHFVGTNFGGGKDYFHDAPVSKQDGVSKKSFLDKQVEYLRKINKIAVLRGIELISCTEDSPINEFLPFKTLDISTQESELRYG